MSTTLLSRLGSWLLQGQGANAITPTNGRLSRYGGGSSAGTTLPNNQGLSNQINQQLQQHANRYSSSGGSGQISRGPRGLSQAANNINRFGSARGNVASNPGTAIRGPSGTLPTRTPPPHPFKAQRFGYSQPSPTGTNPITQAVTQGAAGATGGTGATVAAGAGGGLFAPVSANPAGVTLALGTAALAGGLALGNAVYEGLGRPFGPSLGDYGGGYSRRLWGLPSGETGPIEGPTAYDGGDPIPTTSGTVWGSESVRLRIDWERVSGGGEGPRTSYSFGPIRVEESGNRILNNLNQQVVQLKEFGQVRAIVYAIYPDTGQPGDNPLYPPGAEPPPATPIQFPGIPATGAPTAEPEPQLALVAGPEPEPNEADALDLPEQFSRADNPLEVIVPLAAAGALAHGTGTATRQALGPTAPLTQPPTPNPPANLPATRRATGCGCNGGINAHTDQAISGLNRQLDRKLDAISAAADAGNTAGNAAILAKLVEMQAFAAKAWQNTHADKLINLLTLVSVIHNGAMISRDIGETLGYVVSNALAVVGVNDEDGNPLDINGLVGDSVENFIRSVVGDDVYDDTRTAWQKANRVIQAGSNIVWTIRNIQDATQDVLEWTAENTGKIGNALKKYGVVGERAYPYMAERVRAQDFYRRKFNRVFEGLENAEESASSLAVVTSNVREIQLEVTELGEARTRFTDAVTAFGPEDTPDLPAANQLATKAPENQPIAAVAEAEELASVSPDVTIATDANRGEIDPDAPA